MSAERKTSLRKQMKTALKAMTKEEMQTLDLQVCEHLFEVPLIAGAKYIYGYMNLSWETGTKEILDRLWNQGVQVALPKVLGDTMEFFYVKSASDLEEGSFHIMEPKASCEQICWPDAPILVPGLAFSRNGKRLGKGGGYYDKFLSKEPNHPTVALAYEFQIMDEIPAEEYDQSVDAIVTESGIYIM